ncbi:MAG: tannase/feruloyl esterase family alpha/beta hydrolase, partial [Syntrophorhabdaceae bacterium]|nr:tannase/feruloyl esterase family alpha/beta hydrolase [Syntrophorhabdaceae bacterium]
MRKNIFLLLALFFLVAACGGGNSDSPINNYTPTVAVGGTPTLAATAQAAAAALPAAFSYPNTTITSTTFVADSSVNVTGIGPMPEHVVVKGFMNPRVSPVDGKNYAIGFEMRLPTNWNGRFFYQANGGLDGSVVTAYGGIGGGGPTSNALKKGFAVISSDAGHTAEATTIGGGVFGLDPQARIDYGYNAVAQLTPMAKNLIKTYYGKFPDKSYLGGCSNGGRHAMVAASRYADMYDGILAGDPGINLPQAAIAQLWGAQQFATISDVSANTGRPDINTSFTATELALVSDAIIAKCDTLDGVKDGMVTDWVKCQDTFDLYSDVPTCAGARNGTCLTIGQKAVLTSVHAGIRNSKGTPLYINFPWDPGIRSSGWRSWKFSASITNRDPLAVAFVFTVPPQDPTILNGTGNTLLDYALNWSGTGFDVDRDAPKIYATNATYTESAMSFMTPPDPLMKKLPHTHTKLIVYHGTGDPVFSVADTVKWYDTFLA